jgi:hypothetical protein
MPVALSGVMLRAKVTPHGPRHAVKCMFALTPPATAGGSGPFTGCPERTLARFGMPFGSLGVWQSWHPPSITSWAPRAADVAGEARVIGRGGGYGLLGCWAAVKAVKETTIRSTNTLGAALRILFLRLLLLQREPKLSYRGLTKRFNEKFSAVARRGPQPS